MCVEILGQEKTRMWLQLSDNDKKSWIIFIDISILYSQFGIWAGFNDKAYMLFINLFTDFRLS